MQAAKIIPNPIAVLRLQFLGSHHHPPDVDQTYFGYSNLLAPPFKTEIKKLRSLNAATCKTSVTADKTTNHILSLTINFALCCFLFTNLVNYGPIL